MGILIKTASSFSPIKHGIFPAVTAGMDAVDFAAGNPVGGIIAGNVASSVAYDKASRLVKKKMLNNNMFRRAVRHINTSTLGGKIKSKVFKALPGVSGAAAGIVSSIPAYLGGNYLGAKYAPIYTYKGAKKAVAN